MRIMFMANAPWCTTGYGVQGKHLVPRLKQLGHDVAYFAFYGLQNGLINIGGTTIYPMGYAPWGEDILDAHMRHFKADVLITLLDVWVTDFFGSHAQRNGWSWLPWTPIDQEPVPRMVLERLRGARMVLPYSRWGEEKLREEGIENVRYIPHGVDTNVFRPGEQREARRILNLPEDAFIIGMVAANQGYPPRKCFPEQLRAFATFKRFHKDAVMYLHTLKTPARGGIDFSELLRRLDLREGVDVLFSDQYSYTIGWPEERMATLYQAFDILSLTSSGEGFGIPIVEAQACGIPVVTANNSAMPELTFAGRIVDRQHAFWTPLGSWSYLPDPEAIVDAYHDLYTMLRKRNMREELAEQARAGALLFDWDYVAQEYWAPLLEELSLKVRENGRERSRESTLQQA